MNNKNITVYVYNIVEDELDFIKSSRPSPRLTKEIEVMEDTGDCFFLAEAAAESNFIYVSPKIIKAAFQNYARSLFGSFSASVIVPRRRNHELCLDLINDKSAWNRLIRLLRCYKKVNLLAYSSSPGFYRLSRTLTDSGIKVITPQSPLPRDSWTVKSFGSKSGVRQIAAGFMPRGIVCAEASQAVQAATNKYLSAGGVVIKTNKGSGGGGVLIFRKNSLPDNRRACAARLETVFKRHPYWQNSPVVVEELVDVDHAAAGGFPDAEYQILPGGKVNLLFHGVMKVNKKGEYCGMDVNADILPARLKAKMLKIGRAVAGRYAKYGYRGHFDVDMIVAKSGRLYVCETNMRNTGWTDVYRIVNRLLGPNWLTRFYVLNRDDCRLTKGRWHNFSRLIQTLSPLLYSPRKKSGIIISSSRSILRNYLYYTIIAADKKSAYACKDQLIQLLKRPLPHRVL